MLFLVPSSRYDLLWWTEPTNLESLHPGSPTISRTWFWQLSDVNQLRNAKQNTKKTPMGCCAERITLVFLTPSKHLGRVGMSWYEDDSYCFSREVTSVSSGQKILGRKRITQLWVPALWVVETISVAPHRLTAGVCCRALVGSRAGGGGLWWGSFPGQAQIQESCQLLTGSWQLSTVIPSSGSAV